jgi:2-polyprenyl-6-methoxyphenol hydroxylase-like FAD-dependent oxidoreductase
MRGFAPMDIVIIGAGVAGLGTALHLGKAGHRVTLLERDPAPPDDVEEAWETWERRGVPQSRLAHVFLGRMRNAIRDDHPDLYADLLAAGAHEICFTDWMPPTVEDRSPRPLDDDIVMLGIRRVALEHHLRGAVQRCGVDVRSDAGVAGVVAGTPVADGIPHVVGVTLEDGSTIDADLVVDCGGRRSPLPRWLESLGAGAPPEEHVEDGLMYFGRFYRLAEGRSFPAHGSPIVDLGFLFSLTFEADRGYFAIALAVHAEDKRMRSLRDPDVYEAALQAMPATALWRTPGLAEPASEVKTMSGIDDRWRDLVVDGRPLVTGLVAVGDSVVATNPAFGRGSSLAWVTGKALVDVVAEHAGDPVALATAHHAETTRLVRGWYEQTAGMDANRLVIMRALLDGQSLPEPDVDDPSVSFPIGLQLASTVDPEVYRAFACVAHLLQDPMEILADPHVATAAIDAFERRASIPPLDAGPTREEVLAAMASAGSPAAAG